MILKELLRNRKFVFLGLALLVVIPFEVLSLSGKHLPQVIELLLFGVIILIFGRDVFKKGIKNLFKLNFSSINLLMTVAVAGAVAIGKLEEAVIVIVLFSIGEVLEDFGIDRSKSALEDLVSKTPKTATLKDGSTSSVEDIKIDSIIIIKHGDIIPLDGIIVSGTSLVDEASITGEPLPKTKVVGDQVFAGTTASDGYIEVRVTKLSSDSTIQKIINLTYEAVDRKSQSQVFIERFAKIYTPLILLIAIFIVIIPVVLFHQPFVFWFTQALTLLIISCPCALVISTPVSVFSAVGNASKQGVVIKGGRFMEEIGKIKAIAFDKTRTLTKGEPAITDVVPFGDNTEAEVLECLAGLETFSEHPISKSIVIYAQQKGLKLHTYQDFKAVSGKGVEGLCLVCTDSHRCAGTLSYINQEHGSVSEKVIEKAGVFEKQGKSVIFVSNGKEIKGIVALADEIKKESKDTISELKKLGIEPIMLTGDAEASASYVSSLVGIKTFYSSLLPENKTEKITLLKSLYKSVAMVGDGVNDAPSLASADVGIAMASVGSDVAVENADIAIMNDKISTIPYLIQLSRKTNGIILFNTILAIMIKVLFVGLTVVGKDNLVMAIMADVGVTIFVILNSLRLYGYHTASSSLKLSHKTQECGCA